MKPVFILLLLFYIFIPAAFAHEGEEHGDEGKPAVTSAPVNKYFTPLSIEKETNTKDGQFKFHIKQYPSEVHEEHPVNFDIQLTEVIEGSFEGDPPVEDAKIIAEIQEESSTPETVNVIKNNEPGNYGFIFTFHKGSDFQITLNLVTSDNRKASVKFPVKVIGNQVNYQVYVINFIILVILIIAVFIFYRRVADTLPQNESITKTVVFALISIVVFAISVYLLPKLFPLEMVQFTENTEVKPVSDNLLQVPKETQLLFNIHTQEAEERKIISGLAVTGVVKTRPQSKAEIISPVAGRIQVNNISVGSDVNKGQALAFLEQVLSVPESATIQTTLTDLRLKTADLQSRLQPAKEKLKSAQAEAKQAMFDLKAKTSELQAQVEQAKTKVEASKMELDRAQKLFDIGAAPLKRVQEAQFQVRTSEQELIAIQKQKTYNIGSDSLKRLRDAELHVKLNEQELVALQTQIAVIESNSQQLGSQSKGFTLTAPISGTVSEIRSATGEQVEAGKPVVSIINLDKVWIEAQVFEKDLGQVTHSAQASFKLPAYPNDIFYIKPDSLNRLLTVGSSVNPEKRTIPVIYEVVNSSGKFRDGMFAEITIDTSGDNKVISVKKDAVTDETGRKFVYVFKGGETFEKREIITGSEGQKEIEITNGLKSGERVVTEGIYQLKSVTVGKK